MILCLITSEVLKLKRLKNLSEVNYSLQTNLWRKIVTHQANLPHQTWCNDYVRIPNLYGWKAHSKVLPPNFWSIVVRKGWKKPWQNLTSHHWPTCEKILKVHNLNFRRAWKTCQNIAPQCCPTCEKVISKNPKAKSPQVFLK